MLRSELGLGLDLGLVNVLWRLAPHRHRSTNLGDFLKDLPASYVVAWAVILQVLDLRPLVTMTANSYMVFGLRPVTVWLSAVVSAD